MTAGAPSGMQVERVLEDLIARLSRSEPSKEVRAALIEARRLRSVTLTWTAIPPPSDARREMLSKVMDLVARVGVGAAPRSSAEVRAEAAHLTLSPPPLLNHEHPATSRPRSTPPPPPVSAGFPGKRSGSVMPAPDDEAPPVSIPSHEVRTRRFDSDPPAPKSSRYTTPLPFRKAPSAAALAPTRRRSTPSTTAVSPQKDAAPSTVAMPGARRSFGSGASTQTNLARPLRTTISSGVSLVRPQATAWQAYPRVPGAKLKLLWRDGDSGNYTALLHLAPGTALPARRHATVEEMLLVEGAAMVGSWEMRAGEYCRAEAGSVHEVIRSDEGCTFFVTGSENDAIVEEPEA